MPYCRVFYGADCDPARYYPAVGHEIVSKHILTGLFEGESLQVVLGDHGAGKTTLALRWLAEITDRFDTIYLPAKRYPHSECFLRDLSDEFGLPATEGMWGNRRQIEERLLRAYEQNKPNLLLVDGAHQLSDDTLSDLMNFTNLKGTNGNALSLVLLGHHSLWEHLERQGTEASFQSCITKQTIPPLELDELADFARQQIRAAGLDPDVIIGPDILNLMASLARGNIGLLVLLLRLSWRITRLNELESIDIEAVETACDSIPQFSTGSTTKLDLSEIKLSAHGISA